MLVHRPKTWPMMKIISVEVRELLLLKPLHQNHSPNRPPNRSQSLFLATSANKARLDSTTQVLMGNLAELSNVQRLGLKCLKALLYSYCPALLALGVLVRECVLVHRLLRQDTLAFFLSWKCGGES